MSARDFVKACEGKNKSRVKFLMKDRTLKEHINELVDGTSGLHAACRYASAKIVRNLLSKGADSHIMDKEGNLPIHLACASSVEPLDKVKILIETDRKNIHAAGWAKKTPLHSAAESGNQEVVIYLLQNRADAHAGDDVGWTALHHATQDNHYDVIKALIYRGACINQADKRGETALHKAALWANLSTVKLLASHPRCDISIKNHYGYTAADIARRQNNADIHQYLASIETRSPNNRLTERLDSVEEHLSDLAITDEKHTDNALNSQKEKVRNLEHRLKQLESRLDELDNAQKSNTGKREEMTHVWRALEDIRDEMSFRCTRTASTVERATYTELLSDQMLYKIAGMIGDEQTGLGISLLLTAAEIKQIQRSNTEYKDATFDILITWRDKQAEKSESQRTEDLKRALHDIGKIDILYFIQKVQNFT